MAFTRVVARVIVYQFAVAGSFKEGASREKCQPSGLSGVAKGFSVATCCVVYMFLFLCWLASLGSSCRWCALRVPARRRAVALLKGRTRNGLKLERF